MDKSVYFIFMLLLCGFPQNTVSQVTLSDNLPNEDVQPLTDDVKNATIKKDILPRSNDEAQPKVVIIQEFPYLAYLSIIKGQWNYECVGSIISDRYILTAAHCILGATAITVRVGSTYENSGGRQYQASDFSAHPDYKFSTIDYNVGYIRLKKLMTIDGHSTRVVRLAPSGSPVATGTILKAAGWGVVTEDGDEGKRLMAVQVAVVPDKECRKPYGTITPRSFCVSAPEENNARCQGDLGGPAVSDDETQIGIVSRGLGCAYPGIPGMYTKISSVRSWIKSSTGV